MEKNNSLVRNIISIACILGIVALLVMMFATLSKADEVALGHEKYVSGDYEAAIVHFDNAIASDENNSNAYHNRGLAYYMLGKKGFGDEDLKRKAVSDISRAIELEPDYTDAYYDRGMVNLDFVHHYDKPWDSETIDIYEKALADFRKSLELDENYALAYMGIGNAYYRNGEETWEKALKEYDKALESEDWIREKVGDSGLSGVYASRGRTYMALMETDKSIADYGISLELKPDDCSNLGHQGSNYVIKGDFKKAVETYSKSIDMIESGLSDYPWGAYSYAGRGKAYFEMGEYDKAISDYHIVLYDYGPEGYWERYDAFKQLGMLYEIAGNEEKAKAEFTNAVEAYTEALEDNGSPQMYNDRGYCYMQIGDFEKAEADFLKTLELDPPPCDGMSVAIDYNIEAGKNLGILFSKMGDAEKSREYFQEAIRKADESKDEASVKEIEELLKQL